MISEINSEVFSILSLQAHYCPIESNNEFSEQLNIFLKTRLNTILKVSFFQYIIDPVSIIQITFTSILFVMDKTVWVR